MYNSRDTQLEGDIKAKFKPKLSELSKNIEIDQTNLQNMQFFKEKGFTLDQIIEFYLERIEKNREKKAEIEETRDAIIRLMREGIK